MAVSMPKRRLVLRASVAGTSILADAPMSAWRTSTAQQAARIDSPSHTEDSGDEDAAIRGVPQAVAGASQRRPAEVVRHPTDNPALPRARAGRLPQFSDQGSAEKCHSHSQSQPALPRPGFPIRTIHRQIIMHLPAFPEGPDNCVRSRERRRLPTSGGVGRPCWSRRVMGGESIGGSRAGRGSGFNEFPRSGQSRQRKQINQPTIYIGTEELFMGQPVVHFEIIGNDPENSAATTAICLGGSSTHALRWPKRYRNRRATGF
jgi:hypothetical protein